MFLLQEGGGEGNCLSCVSQVLVLSLCPPSTSYVRTPSNSCFPRRVPGHSAMG